MPFLTPRRASAGLPWLLSLVLILEAVMSRRKHKPTAAAPPPATRGGRTAGPTRPAGYRDSLPVRNRAAAGIDLGLRSHWVAAPPQPDGTPDVAEFDTYTDGLEALADWLAERGVTTVALEATGVYWEPVFAFLEARGFEVL